ncbi:quinoprotein dehydrogenase-associated putative ABC transporter substrate-binding protein [Pseudoduganella plicata]|uniref:Amino acid ABC transporter substrate-binding protein n=1 Tax=Pseudoduganella plicata TaxID=321984 RepID=A0A4P7BMJ8_9BURK|nr:quinoprotein dehydrogenase-associated putative ABC transporter substrate-binding protein [Pseudoduganella plicata]QBQ38859.1 quinoprotein dehydrogenase-associated putative ABC transporter substrate-binding protein [Pseudoduganella plicata]GGZ09678.1 amino acid ABC transporter substrate-binding protein [Pseudoduganella plicata]
MKLRPLLVGAVCLLASGAAAADGPGQDGVLRVCQDPNNLPLSSHALAGFENRIAALLADELHWKLEHTWYPQRMGFIRNTLRAKVEHTERYKCDLVTGVPKGFDMAATTRPYYRSTYAMAYVKGKGLDGVQGLDGLLALDAGSRRKLRFGAFAGSPVTDWLLRHGLMEQVEWYRSQTGDAEQYPGEMIEKDLASGKIDVAFAWGPIAGYFARNAQGAPIVAVPLASTPGLKFDFEIAMAVRHGDEAFRRRIDALLEANGAKIDAILRRYGVPLLPLQP